MDEYQWLEAKTPEPLFGMLPRPTNDRKLRLYVAACHRRLWPLLSDLERKVPVAAEQFLEGKISQVEFDAAYRDNGLFPGDEHAPRVGEYSVERALSEVEYISEYANDPWAEAAAQANLVREVFGNPFRPVAIEPDYRAWNGGAILTLAQALYDIRRLPEGVLDLAQLAALANALEDAGCTTQNLLSHLRGPGPHVLGCWAIDLLLGRQ